MPEIEVLRAGSFTAMNGDPVDILPADLAAIAAGYDRELHEAPVVVGHPATDAPAYGWVRGLAVRDDRLVADVDQLDAGLAELVSAGRYKKISASLYRPGSPTSPKPEAWYLRHVGFLGAQPPAVKGLRPIALGESEGAVTIEFSEGRLGWLASTLASLFAGLRDRLIASEGLEPADRTLPAWQIEALQRLAAEADASSLNASFAETEESPMPDDQAASAAREAELAAREAELAAREAELAERAAVQRRRELEGEVDQLVGAGRVLPAERDSVVGLMAALSADATVELGEGESRPAADVLRGFLAGLPKRVEFGERAPATDAALPESPVDLAERVRALQADEAAKGNRIETDAALQRIMKGAAA